jgi:Xaa-Pro aminopeptidase
LSSPETLLITSDGRENADLYYATRFLAGVAVVYIETPGRKTLLVNDLEYGRAGSEARVDEVVSITPYEEKLRQAGQEPRLLSVLDLYLKEHGIREFIVPAALSFGHAERFREMGYVLHLREDPFFPERSVKKPHEIEAIETAQRHMEEAMAFAVDAIRRTSIRSGVLHHQGAPLMAETLRVEVQKFLLDRGCLASEIIVAPGDQGADPHQRGKGSLPANQTIVIDIFAQSLSTRYWGDMTRTVVRGEASEAVRKLYRDVGDAQKLAFASIHDGAEGNKVHEAVVRHFKERGNLNGEVNGKKTGFIHGTGHGLGLEIHEAPRLGRLSSKLAAGNVVTVEPGLYYPGVGAVRLEDAVVVTADGCRNLNRFPKELELK